MREPSRLTSSLLGQWKGRLASAALAALMAFAPAAAEAQGRGSGIPIVRDAEAERLLADYLRPLVKAAGVELPVVQMIPDQSFNAFVTGRRSMYVNVGAIIKSETPNELIGVLAHETAHIADDDIAQMTQQMEDTKTAVLLAGIVGIGAAAAGVATGSDGMGQAGAGILSGAFGVAQRGMLRYQREQEKSADRAAAQYLNATGQSLAGMLATLQRLADDNLLLSQGANPYLQSHPLPRERVAELEALMAQSPSTGKRDSQGLQLRHDLVRAKLIGFTWSPGNVLRRYPLSDKSLPARYARAIMAFRSDTPAEAQRQIDGLIATMPDNPYFYELKGQALLESGSPRQAIDPLRKALSLDKRSNLLRILLGQALVATDDPQRAREAIEVLAAAMQGDPDIAAGYRSLARAYALTDNVPMAQLATAEGLFVEKNFKEARIQAERAQAKLKTGSPAWLRADDIVSYKPPR